MINLADFEQAASTSLDLAAWGYFAGGANDEITVRENRAAWDRLSIRYRTMIDVSVRDTSTSVLGLPISFPVIIAPTAMQKLAHPDGELATVRAAGKAGTIMCVSTTATTSLEDVRAAATGPTFFQLYVYKDREATKSLLHSAKRVGYSAIVVTVDAPFLGRRERDVRNAFSLPPHLQIANAIAAGRPHTHMPPAEGIDSGLAKHLQDLHDASLTHRDLAWIAEAAGLPVLVKGVVRGDDALRAVEFGAAGVVVSNHGGRQLDTSVTSARALPEIVDAVEGRGEILVDGGIRRGTDVLKALALGARAVLIGRPVLWGLANGGEAGVSAVLELLRGEFELAMALAGCPTVREITRDLIT
jgi:4-hydroxymandelate oxidase